MNIFLTQNRFLLKFRPLIFLIIDIVLIILSVFLAFMVRFEGKIPDIYFQNIWGIIALALLITIPIFYLLKLYSFTWAYVDIEELVSLIKGVFLSFLLLTATFFVFKDHFIFTGFPRSTLFITYFFIFILCSGIRFLKKIYLRTFSKINNVNKDRTLIVGAGDIGEQILRNMLDSKETLNLPIGFVDDNDLSQGISIHGFKVLGKIKDIPEIIKSQQIREMIIALPSAGSKTVKKAIEMGRKSGLKKIRIIPSLNEIMDGRVSIKDLRQVQVDDLLGRDPVSLDFKTIENFIKDKNILITGAAGSIGSELCLQIARFAPLSLIVLDQDETGLFNISNDLFKKFPKLEIYSVIADIQDKNKINQIFKDFSPNIVFHAAAYKHVPIMEVNLDEAVKNNIFGTKIVAEASLKNHVEKFVFVSTDKAINPTSIMGTTKRIGEMICQSLNQENKTKFISVRFGNVLDSRGSVIPIFREQIKKGGPVEVTHPKMKRYFMVNSEACLLVMQAGAFGEGGEVFVLDMGKPIMILDLAKEMIRLSGLEPDKDIPIVFIGIRPGEKLFEEILTDEEATKATHHKKIFISKLSKVKEKELKSYLKDIENSINYFDKKKTVMILRKIVPTYKSKNNL